MQLFSQQTPSTHWVDWHSLGFAQGCPFCFLPQVPVVTPFRVCCTHWIPGAHPVLSVQICVHAPVVQRKGEQSRGGESWQVPLPSHVRCVFSTRPEQEDEPHTVSFGKSVHEPNPSQRPVLPQVVRSLALHAGSVTPAEMKVQWPFEPGWSHETQSPLHATLQHTLSAQKPETQSSPVLQTAPLELLPQLPATHSCSAEHWASVVQL